MKLADKLDIAIKATETTPAEEENGYILNGKTYRAYMTNQKWQVFCDSMTEQARREYREGSGGELEETSTPPKMASYGSSSRMLYLLSRNTDGFHFETKLRTSFGGPGANLDGFAEQDDRYLFVEAKCREPYHAPHSESNPIAVSRAYSELYEHINNTMYGSLLCHMQPHETNATRMKVTYSCDGEPIQYFDIKQMICHLLGIAVAVLEGRLPDKRIDFLYLIYDPTELNMEPTDKAEIEAIYDRLREECISIDFATLFVTLLTYLRDQRGIGTLSDSEIGRYLFDFTFTVCDPQFYQLLSVDGQAPLLFDSKE